LELLELTKNFTELKTLLSVATYVLKLFLIYAKVIVESFWLILIILLEKSKIKLINLEPFVLHYW